MSTPPGSPPPGKHPRSPSSTIAEHLPVAKLADRPCDRERVSSSSEPVVPEAVPPRRSIYTRLSFPPHAPERQVQTQAQAQIPERQREMNPPGPARRRPKTKKQKPTRYEKDFQQVTQNALPPAATVPPVEPPRDDERASMGPAGTRDIDSNPQETSIPPASHDPTSSTGLTISISDRNHIIHLLQALEPAPSQNNPTPTAIPTTTPHPLETPTASNILLQPRIQQAHAQHQTRPNATARRSATTRPDARAVQHLLHQHLASEQEKWTMASERKADQRVRDSRAAGYEDGWADGKAQWTEEGWAAGYADALAEREAGGLGTGGGEGGVRFEQAKGWLCALVRAWRAGRQAELGRLFRRVEMVGWLDADVDAG
ncbi:hypothetical protein BDW02DRAFT_577106 [Decorospora gaudefroyi]|uniref:Uncharacterized protein n=1 Tax=Decorospora gaudefroyi TaxID=184978 RepID=A0A6A5KK56_9PLEO|nr:hypothetical protein BDW02DRAFT_577106 [Decorospora gaudefroyi]